MKLLDTYIQYDSTDEKYSLFRTYFPQELIKSKFKFLFDENHNLPVIIPELLQFIKDTFPKVDEHIRYEGINPTDYFLIIPDSGIMVVIKIGPDLSEPTSLEIGVVSTYSIMQGNLEHLVQYINNFNTNLVESPKLNLIEQREWGMDFTTVNLKYKEEFSLDNYNDSFIQVSAAIEKAVNNKNHNGLILLHGNAGTGKTSYIKYLISISKKKVFYLPPELMNGISSPSFIRFLISELKNAILIIEDAENILKPRDAGGDQAVSNILNISNGIMGDILNTTIICTFNCSVQMIDQALLRPGRLIASYQFEKLDLDKTNNLLQILHGDGVQSNTEMTLAEIYNYDNKPERVEVVKQNIGFY